MIQLAAVASMAAVLGGLVAVTAHDSRRVALGLLLAMMAAPLASSPAPSALTIAFRIIGALLAAYLLWVVGRTRSITSEGSGIGPAADMAVAVAAFSVGWFAVPVKPLAGPLAAQAAGISLVVLAIAPLTGRNILRAGAGLAVLALGASLLLNAWVGPPSALQQVVLMTLLIGVLGSTSMLMSPIEESAALEAAAPAPPAGISTGIEPGEAARAAAVAAAVVAAVEAEPGEAAGAAAVAAHEPREDIGPRPDGKPTASSAGMPAAQAGETNRTSRARGRGRVRTAVRGTAPEASPTAAAAAPPAVPEAIVAGPAADAAPGDSTARPAARTSTRQPRGSIRDGAPVRPLPMATPDDAAPDDETASGSVDQAPSEPRRLRLREPREPRQPHGRRS